MRSPIVEPDLKKKTVILTFIDPSSNISCQKHVLDVCIMMATPSIHFILFMTRTCVFGDSDPRGEAPGYDGVEQHQHKQGQPEEQADYGEEETLCPFRINISCAGRVVRIIFVLSDGQDGRREDYRKQPGDEAHHPRLALCPDQASSKGQTYCIVPKYDSNSLGTFPCVLHTSPL